MNPKLRQLLLIHKQRCAEERRKKLPWKILLYVVIGLIYVSVHVGYAGIIMRTRIGHVMMVDDTSFILLVDDSSKLLKVQ